MDRARGTPRPGAIAAVRRRTTLFWAVAAMAVIAASCPGNVAAADFRIQPSLTVNEEFDDNILLTPNDKKDDYITRVIPAFVLAYKTGFWTWDLDYAYDYRYYRKGTRTDDSTHRANLKNRTELIDNVFFLEVLDQYQRVSLDIVRNYTQESLFLKQSDQNIFTLNPYVVMGLQDNHKLTIGYKYVNSWYKDPAAISTIDHIGYLETGSVLSSNLTFSTGIRYTQDVNKIDEYNKADLYAGPRYAYGLGSYVYCLLGASWSDFAESEAVTHLIWDVGFNHRYSTMTLAVETKTDSVPDPNYIVRRVDQLVATLTKEQTTRSAISVSVGWYEYRSEATNHLEGKSYRLSGSLRHALSPTTILTGELNSSWLYDYTLSEKTYIYQGGVRYEHRILENLTFTLGYWYTNSYSPDTYLQNYINNKIAVDLSYRF